MPSLKKAGDEDDQGKTNTGFKRNGFLIDYSKEEETQILCVTGDLNSKFPLAPNIILRFAGGTQKNRFAKSRNWIFYMLGKSRGCGSRQAVVQIFGKNNDLRK
jgi:hypothetical protein